MKSLALTDTAGLYAAIPFYQAAREAGIKPILGAEIEGAVLLARDREGYTELCRILTTYHCEDEAPIRPLSPSRPPRLLDQISTTNLFILTSNLPLIESLVQRGQKPLVAITHHGDRPSKARAERLRAFAHQMGLRPVAVNPIYFLDPDQIRIHRVLSAIRRNTTVDGLGADEIASPESWFRSQEQMAKLYADWPDTIENTHWVAEHCNVELPLGKPLFPQIELAPGETPFSLLWKQASEGLKEHYQPLTPKVVQRFQYELDIIHQLGFAAYFLIIWDIVCYARAQGIPIVGRGSAANSLVAYVLGITRVDPFKYDLYFERFLNPSRTDCPDIDLDICWRRRDDVIDYVYKKYGAERVAMICTFNTFQARSAMRETAKTFGFTDEEAGEVVRQLPHYRANDIRTVVKFLPECRHLRIDEEPLKSILEISEAIDGFPRHLSIHSGGVVIAPEPLTRFVPLQRATKGILITQYDMHPIEDLGLIKMDLLGHRSLTVIQETVELIQRNKGLSIDVERLPDPDKLTADLIRNARTIGCFQIESPAMRALLKSVRADNTDMLIKTLSLIRPGPSGSGMKKHFIDRHLGKEEVVYLHPALEKVLGDTYGVMLYQEDILKVASVIAGMNLSEADALRRAMTKKRTAKEMAKSMKLFMEKAKANGVGEKEAETIWGLIANFAEYSYCKAHASTYGEIAYQCTYLKAHFPAEFLASVLSNRGGFYYPAVYLEEARRSGIGIYPADVNKSEFNYSVEGDAIRVGFLEIRNLTRNAVRSILNARKAEPFQGIADLCRRANLTYADAEVLIQAGACDGLRRSRPVFPKPACESMSGHARSQQLESAESRFWKNRPTGPEMLWELKTIFQSAGRKAALDERLLFPYDRGDAVLPHLPDYSRKKRTDLEWNNYGLLISKHPIEYYVPAMLDRPRVLSEDMPAYAGDTVTMVGWLIAERRVGLKGRGVMKFLTFEDPVGVFEAVLFPKVYQQYGHLLTSHGPYFITGEVQDEDGYNSLIAGHVERVGHNKKSPHHSEITPPLHWLFPYLRETALTHAD
jgi:DNA-directed DNA polymerase III PolC